MINLYNRTAPGSGVYSKLNGGLHEPDLRSGAKFDRAHVWPGLVNRAHSESMLSPAEFFSDSGPVGSPTLDDGWSPIIGASIRFYQPHDCRCALIDLTAYLSFWSPLYVNDRPKSEGGTPNKESWWTFRVRLVLDGETRTAQNYKAPLSAIVVPSWRAAGDFDLEGDVRTHEAGQGFCWSQHKLTSLDKGWHQAHLEVKMSIAGSAVFAGIKRGAKKMNNTVRYYQRLFAGIRSARVLTLT